MRLSKAVALFFTARRAERLSQNTLREYGVILRRHAGLVPFRTSFLFD